MSKRYNYSPLRYPGGKSVLNNWMEELFLQNNLDGGTYAEPYAGGAGVALFLLLNGLAKKIIINDYDLAIYAIWHSIVNHTDQFITKIEKTEISLEEWKRQKTIFSKPTEHSLLDLGFSAFYLNRTNVSGIIKGGPIGGKKQNGKYHIDSRFNKISLIEKIKLIGLRRNDIQVTNYDAIEFINKVGMHLDEKSLVYFDPPYYLKGSQLYRNYYKHEDHKFVSENIKKLKTPWLLTYDNCPEIQDLYEDFKGFDFYLRYSASLKQKTVGSELMYYNYLNYISKPNLVA